MLVIDTSATFAALLTRDVSGKLLDRLDADDSLHAPELIDLEFLHALRRESRRGSASDEVARDVRADFDRLPIRRYPHRPLSDRIWALRHSLTPYDAAFVALAELLDAPLVTCDAHLAAAPGHAAEIELY